LGITASKVRVLVPPAATVKIPDQVRTCPLWEGSGIDDVDEEVYWLVEETYVTPEGIVTLTVSSATGILSAFAIVRVIFKVCPLERQVGLFPELPESPLSRTLFVGGEIAGTFAGGS
jgi:hypothetical protein